jgi:hypothetical protein
MILSSVQQKIQKNMEYPVAYIFLLERKKQYDNREKLNLLEHVYLFMGINNER